MLWFGPLMLHISMGRSPHFDSNKYPKHPVLPSLSSLPVSFLIHCPVPSLLCLVTILSLLPVIAFSCVLVSDIIPCLILPPSHIILLSVRVFQVNKAATQPGIFFTRALQWPENTSIP